MLGREHRESGFTLIELMIVVAIIGLTAAIAMPSYTGWLAKSQLREAAMMINSQLTMGRFAAMNRNRTVTVTISAVPGQVNITSTDANGPAMSPYAVNASYVMGVGGVPTFQFDSLGLRAGGGADQILTVSNSQGLTYSVRVTGGGKASWCPRTTCP